MSNPRRANTFKDLKDRWGWPYCRQHTNTLVKKKRFPKPGKIPGGSVNIWTDEQLEPYFASLPSDNKDEAA